MELFIVSDENMQNVVKLKKCSLFVSIEEVVDFINKTESSILKDISLVIHSTIGDFYNEGMLLTKLSEKYDLNIIYLNSNPNKSFTVMLESLGASVIERDFYLTDVDDFDYLMENINTFNTSGKKDNSSLLYYDKMIEIIEGISSSLDSLQRRQIRRIINQMRENTSNLAVMSTNALDVVQESFINTLSLVEGKQKDLDDIARQLKELQDREKVEGTPLKSLKLGDTLSHFSPYRHSSGIKVLVLKEYSACRYLTSFALAYLKHCETRMSLNVRLLVVSPNKDLQDDRYSDFHKLTKSNYKSSDSIRNHISYTTEPFRELLEESVNRNDALLVVIDRTYEKEPIYKGAVTVVNAVSSLNEANKFKLPLNKCLFTITSAEKSVGTIQHIKAYPQNNDSRYSRYLTTFKDVFEKLDSMLDLDIL